MKRWLPTSLRGQVLAVVAVALALAQAVSLWLFADERDLAVRAALARETLDRAANVLALLDTAAPEARGAIIAAANSPLVRFSMDDKPVLAHDSHATRALQAEVENRFAGDRQVFLELHEARGVMPPMPGMPAEMQGMHQGMAVAAVELQLSAALADGQWLNVTTRFHRPPLQWAAADVATFLISAAFIAVAVWLLLGRITRPLARLSDAANRMGGGDWTEEIQPQGPAELARLATAFNRMQARLRRFVDERSRIFAALGHDLRSPLTALRVRAEMVDDDDTRAGLVASIDEMHEMVENTLNYARDSTSAEAFATVDLGAYLTRLVSEYAEIGRDVQLEGSPPPAIAVKLQPSAARRALRNLIDNALRFGVRARLSVEVRDMECLVQVDDDGPGIPDTETSKVFEPFVRLESSRSRETGGTGLGLAIARSIIRAQGGDITLANRDEGGLRATVVLPVVDAAGEEDLPPAGGAASSR